MGCAREKTKNGKTYMDPFENGYCEECGEQVDGDFCRDKYEECRKVESCTAYTKKEKRENTWNSL